jgi:predicted small lipoprotein YifL
MRAILTVVVTMLLIGCGLKDDLYLLEVPEPAQQQSPNQERDDAEDT